MRRDKSEENVADLGTEPVSKAVIAKHCSTQIFLHGRRQCLVQTARRGDVLGLRFDAHRDGWQNSQRAQHSR